MDRGTPAQPARGEKLTESDEPGPELTVVVPVHDEQPHVGLLYERLRAACGEATLTWELVYVDDGSRDETLARCHQLARADSRVRVVALIRNFGHQAALQAGLALATGRWVAFMDGDLEHPPELLPQMLQRARQRACDVVAMVKRRPGRRTVTSWLSALFYRLFNLVSEVPIFPGASDFCLLSRRVAAQLRSLDESRPFFRAMIPALGFPTCTMTFEVQPRGAGRPSYSPRRRLDLALTALFHHTTVALDVMTAVGALVATGAFLYAAFSIGVRLLFEERVTPGWADIICSVLVLGGLNMVFLAVIGRYVQVLLDYAKRRPAYIVDEPRSILARQRAEGNRDAG